MKNTTKMIVGMITFMVSLWCGAYCMDTFQFNDWRKFPAFMSFSLIGFYGVVTFVFAFSDENSK